jgi:thiol-disulfide isomerase/thioredoxin
VLLNVWASWCTPCEDESPDLVAFQEEHGGADFTILGIQTQDGTEDGLAFVDDFGLNYPSLRDGSGDYADELGATGVPETLLIDPEGDVAYIRRGQVDRELLDAEVLPLIEGA